MNWPSLVTPFTEAIKPSNMIRVSGWKLVPATNTTRLPLWSKAGVSPVIAGGEFNTTENAQGNTYRSLGVVKKMCFGPGPVDGKTQAHVISIEKSPVLA